jgi:hypothetical protein
MPDEKKLILILTNASRKGHWIKKALSKRNFHSQHTDYTTDVVEKIWPGNFVYLWLQSI